MDRSDFAKSRSFGESIRQMKFKRKVVELDEKNPEFRNWYS